MFGLFALEERKKTKQQRQSTALPQAEQANCISALLTEEGNRVRLHR
jgi:hypothetical protein